MQPLPLLVRVHLTPNQEDVSKFPQSVTLSCNERTTFKDLEQQVLSHIRTRRPDHPFNSYPDSTFFYFTEYDHASPISSLYHENDCVARLFQTADKPFLELLIHVLSGRTKTVGVARSTEVHSEKNESHQSIYTKGCDNLKVFLGTFNLGNAAPPLTDQLRTFIPGVCEIIVVGVQEAKYQSWMSCLAGHLGGEYYLVSTEWLMEIGLAVFALRQYRSRISDVTSCSVATGIGNVLGNKGGVCIHFCIDDTSFCFVNSHLAAHQQRTQNRHTDVERICRQLKPQSHMDLVNSVHFLFWMGDLNYRINFSEFFDAVDARSPTLERFDDMMTLISTKQTHILMEKDQLIIERDMGRVFRNFREGPVTFNPTFRVERGKRLTYTTQRLPAYCDRILWLCAPGLKLAPPIVYKSVEQIMTSDHKPVHAVMNVPIWTLPAANNPRAGC